MQVTNVQIKHKVYVIKFALMRKTAKYCFNNLAFNFT